MPTHHAYIYEGSQGDLSALAADARERFGFPKEHSPDVHVREMEKFGIEESRWLIEAAALRSSSGKALFLIGTPSLTSEAQQALLKLFEEPQEGVVFVLLCPHGIILPTLRSRMLPYPASLAEESASVKEAKAFLKMAGKERSDFVAKMLKDDDGAKERARDFVNALEALLAPKAKDAKVRTALEDLAMARDYLRDRAPSLKMLLEHLALALPSA